MSAKNYESWLPVESVIAVKVIESCLFFCHHVPCLLTVKSKKSKGRYSSAWGKPILELQEITCHVGSHSVTCHPTHVNVPRLTPARQAGTQFAYPGGMEG